MYRKISTIILLLAVGIHKIMKYIKLLFCLLATMSMAAQNVTVKDTVMTTYPFGDPNPIPQVKRNCYPYCNFEQFATTPVQQAWKMVVPLRILSLG